ncbi:hypothetical protein ACFLYA_01270 [Candidatus Dependentiae bacterium]
MKKYLLILSLLSLSLCNTTIGMIFECEDHKEEWSYETCDICNAQKLYITRKEYNSRSEEKKVSRGDGGCKKCDSRCCCNTHKSSFFGKRKKIIAQCPKCNACLCKQCLVIYSPSYCTILGAFSKKFTGKNHSAPIIIDDYGVKLVVERDRLKKDLEKLSEHIQNNEAIEAQELKDKMKDYNFEEALCSSLDNFDLALALWILKHENPMHFNAVKKSSFKKTLNNFIQKLALLEYPEIMVEGTGKFSGFLNIVYLLNEKGIKPDKKELLKVRKILTDSKAKQNVLLIDSYLKLMFNKKTK